MTYYRTLPLPTEGHGKNSIISVDVEPPAVLFPTLDFETNVCDFFSHQLL